MRYTFGTGGLIKEFECFWGYSWTVSIELIGVTQYAESHIWQKTGSSNCWSLPVCTPVCQSVPRTQRKSVLRRCLYPVSPWAGQSPQDCWRSVGNHRRDPDQFTFSLSCNKYCERLSCHLMDVCSNKYNWSEEGSYDNIYVIHLCTFIYL